MVVSSVIKMNKVYIITVAVFIAVAITAVRCDTTPAEQCPGQNFEGLIDRIKVSPCGSKHCRLRKNTNTTVEFKFKTVNKVDNLINEVYAILGGIPLPFVGVTGVSACSLVKRADTGEPAPCPLAANQEYLYTNQFPIEPFYPQIAVRVHWGLKDDKKYVICFEVPAIITK